MGKLDKPCRYQGKMIYGQKVLGYAECEKKGQENRTWLWVQCICGKETAKTLSRLKKKGEGSHVYCSQQCPVYKAKMKHRGEILAETAKTKRGRPSKAQKDIAKWQNCFWCGHVATNSLPNIPVQLNWGRGWTEANQVAECRPCNHMRDKTKPQEFLQRLRAVILRHGELPPENNLTVRWRISREEGRLYGEEALQNKLQSPDDE